METNVLYAVEKTTSEMIMLRAHISREWVRPEAKKEAEAVRRAITAYLRAIGEE